MVTTRAARLKAAGEKAPPKNSELSVSTSDNDQKSSPRKNYAKVSDYDESETDIDAYEDYGKASNDRKRPALADLDSDNLDDFDDDPLRNQTNGKTPYPKKRRTTPSSSLKRNGKKKPQNNGSDEESLDDELKVEGKVVHTPTRRVAPGQISQNTLNFLKELSEPEKNDRVWFKLHEPVYRQAEKEWKAFIDEFTDVLSEADPQIPPLAPKDVIHRIYRDIRFSNNKTPYKTNLSASFSRTGRKGIFAAYHISSEFIRSLNYGSGGDLLSSVSVKPGNSLLAGGAWCPGKDQLACIRHSILQDSTRLRNIISSKKFVKYFGEPKPQSNGKRSNIFGRDDELKVAPKGVDKNHKEIDLLKLRTFAVHCKFEDDEVLAPDFIDHVGKLVRVLRPFVHCLNDMMIVTATSDNEDDSDEEE